VKTIEQVIIGKYLIYVSTEKASINEIVHGCAVYRGAVIFSGTNNDVVFCGECSDQTIIDTAMDLLLMEQI
jgi:uncharacterized protein (DUF169 family)